MAEALEDVSDWEALRRFRSLTPQEQNEQLFMTTLASSRSSRANNKELVEVKEAVLKQNGRVLKAETRIIQIFAVLGFLGVAIPILISAASLR